MKSKIQIITDSLNTLCSNHRTEASKSLVAAWTIGLNDIEQDYIMKALEPSLHRKSPFMPTVGEFRAICKQIKKTEVIALRRAEEQKQIEYERDHGPELISYKEYCKRTNREPSDYFGSSQVTTEDKETGQDS